MGLNIGGVYAKAGERVTCKNGHDVCEFTETVMVGDKMDLHSQLKFLDGQRRPQRGDHLRDCKCHCGASYMHRYKSGVFHFADGWR